jgi:hypothetical protein
MYTPVVHQGSIVPAHPIIIVRYVVLYGSHLFLHVMLSSTDSSCYTENESEQARRLGDALYSSPPLAPKVHFPSLYVASFA